MNQAARQAIKKFVVVVFFSYTKFLQQKEIKKYSFF